MGDTRTLSDFLEFAILSGIFIFVIVCTLVLWRMSMDFQAQLEEVRNRRRTDAEVMMLIKAKLDRIEETLSALLEILKTDQESELVAGAKRTRKNAN